MLEDYHAKFLALTAVAVLLLASCGVDSGSFRIEGSFKGLNQGELYIYSPDGSRQKLDTIAIKGGRFSYQTELDSSAMFVIVFPNYSELPVFGESGKQVEIEGNASHLKQTKVKGTKENELMTGFRLSTSEKTPPEVVKAAVQFVREHPDALGSIYLVNKYFIQTTTADYQQASELMALIRKSHPDGKRFKVLTEQLEGLKTLKEDARLPKFVATDINGKTISNVDLNAKVNVISTWATWNFESQSIQRKLHTLQLEKGSNNMKLVSFCLDADEKSCRRFLDRDSIRWSNVCHERMWETPALVKLGLSFVPDNIITDSQGKVIAHSLTANELDKKIRQLLE